tara:strand:+ start:1080 stop:2492 length:1413 start_codon:yes stop_codon:yes gene_type:complete
MNKQIILTAGQKAFRINKDKTIYGSIVEIGAGQEVARQFFRVGSASKTIAKTMSAYDRDFSDAIYGKEDDGRYVCKSRLNKMLDQEYGLLEQRLNRKDHKDTRYFVFADTVTTINYDRTVNGHGWIGLRFQIDPEKAPNDFLIHVRLKDQEAKLQQETIGIIGTNLMYGCFNETDPKEILNQLYDNLSRENFEIDMVEVLGPDFEKIDNRLLSLTLVKERMTNAVIFTPDGKNKYPSDVLFQKNILAVRGSFRPVTKVNIDMLDEGLKKFKDNKKVDEENIQLLFEITLSNLMSDGQLDERDFLDRADILCSLGYTVMISNYMKYYKLCEYLSRYSDKRLGFIIGVDNLVEMFEEKYYRNLNGGIMEAFGIMLTRDIKIYLYPSQRNSEKQLINSKNIIVHPRAKSIYKYLLNNKRIEDLDYEKDILGIYSRDVLKKIKSCEIGTWEHMVPDGVADIIKDKSLFGMTCKI